MSLRVPIPTKAEIRTAKVAATKAVLPLAVSLLRRRTARGMGLNGSFRPYTRGYRHAKQASGRDSGVVDLTLSGQMMNNLKPKAIRADGSGAIGFDGVHRASRFRASKRAAFSAVDTKRKIRKRTLKRGEGSVPMATIVLANDRLRPFLGFTDEERRELKARFDEVFARTLTEILRSRR